MDIQQVQQLIQDTFSNVHIEKKEEQQIIPSKRGMLVVRNRSFSGGGEMLTIVGLAVDFPLLQNVRDILAKKIKLFSEDVDNYQGKAFLYISILFK